MNTHSRIISGNVLHRHSRLYAAIIAFGVAIPSGLMAWNIICHYVLWTLLIHPNIIDASAVVACMLFVVCSIHVADRWYTRFLVFVIASITCLALLIFVLLVDILLCRGIHPWQG